LEVNQKTLDGIAELNEMLETQRRQIESLKNSVAKLKQNDSKLKVTIAYNTEKEVDHKYHNAQLKDNLDRFKYPSSMSFPKLDRDLLLVYCVISNHLFPDLNKSRLDKIIAAGTTRRNRDKFDPRDYDLAKTLLAQAGDINISEEGAVSILTELKKHILEDYDLVVAWNPEVTAFNVMSQISYNWHKAMALTLEKMDINKIRSEVKKGNPVYLKRLLILVQRVVKFVVDQPESHWDVDYSNAEELRALIDDVESMV